MTTIALAGNPNAGKSTLFNALTGSHQHVGNWPGKTVEKKEGRLKIADQQISIVDLPGTYSLTAYSVEEIITRDFILNEHPEAVVAVVDAANLERNLYLVLQLLEMGTPLILALNMSDVAESRGIKIDMPALSQALGGIRIVRTIGVQETGLEDLKQAISQTQPRRQAPLQVPLPAELEQAITALAAQIEPKPSLTTLYHPRWLAIKLLERDDDIREKLAAEPALIEAGERAAEHIEALLGDDPDTLIAESRYNLIATWTRAYVTRPTTSHATLSDKLDRIMTHRIWGLPIFLGLMWFVFQLTANVSAPYVDWIDGTVNGPLHNWASHLFIELGLGGSWLMALVVDGVIAGVGGVLVFVPVLVSLYLALAILEDSGYMARAAFVMDRVMYSFGLQGKSFLPLLVGFGCSVPAVYATRTLENPTDRKITGFLTTFMSCSARLPVYVLFGAIFFDGSGLFIFLMYVLGIIVAVLTSFLLTRVVYKDKPTTPFVMEMPPYRLPNLKVVGRSTWHRTSSFIRRAGTTILAASLLIWLLLAIPVKQGKAFNEVNPEDSLFGTTSQVLAPVFKPAGYGNWEASGALITGFAAKEIIIATMTQIYVDQTSTEEELPSMTADAKTLGTSFLDATILTVQEVINIIPRTVNLIPRVNMPEADLLGQGDTTEDTSQLESALGTTFTPLSAVAFNVFILLYVPCMSAVAAMRHEFGWRWTAAQVAYTLSIAWIASVLVYQIGLALGV